MPKSQNYYTNKPNSRIYEQYYNHPKIQTPAIPANKTLNNLNESPRSSSSSTPLVAEFEFPFPTLVPLNEPVFLAFVEAAALVTVCWAGEVFPPPLAGIDSSVGEVLEFPLLG